MKKTKDSDKPSIWVEAVTHNKICITLIVLIIYLAIMVVVCVTSSWNWEKIYYISQIISGVFVVGGLVVSILQYTASNIYNSILRNQERKIKAAEMANEFQRTVIPLISKLSQAYSDEKLKEAIIDRLDSSQLTHFNKEELERIFPKNLYIIYRAQVARHYAMEVDSKFEELDNKYRTDKSLTEEEKEQLGKVLSMKICEYVQEVSAICTELSNMLEYMCICFNTNIADDTTVYQSLHKVFFQGVQMIYIFTFDVNENEHDRLYYNIMLLYKKWKETYNEKKCAEEQLKEKMESEVDNIKNKYREGITVRPGSI